MKKGIKIFGAVLLIIVLILGIFVYKQWNSIEAFIHSFSTTNEETQKELEENKEALQQFIDGNEDISVRDLTEEESAALASGELSEEEVVQIITGKSEEAPEKTTPESKKTNEPEKDSSGEETPKPTKEPTPKPEATAKPTKEPTPKPVETAKPAQNADVSELIAKLYVQKSTYLNKLDSIEAQVRSEFLSQRENWDSKKQAKSELLAKYLPMVSAWEKECDSTVYGIIDQIRAKLKNAGKDTSIADTLKQSYLEEKKLKKTYFINRYMD